MKRPPSDRRCSYVAIMDGEGATSDELRDLADYLSLLGVAGCEVVIVDSASKPSVDRNCRVLRWVGRYFATSARDDDPVRRAADLAACEKVIVADAHVRYDEDALDDMCALLDLHEVVEPQDYFDPLPWWGGIDAGRMLVHRGIEPLPDRGATFGFLRSAVRGLRGIDSAVPSADHVRRLALQGGEVFSATHLFVRRLPLTLDRWMRLRPVEADADFFLPAKTIFFLSLLPVMTCLAAFAGVRVTSTYAGAIAFGSVALAMRGRVGAAPFFPWRACLFAPLWVLERSISIYWALFRKFGRIEGRAPDRPYASASKPRSASASLS